MERFNSRVAEVLRTHRFDAIEGLETTLHALCSSTTTVSRNAPWATSPPVQALKNG
ncbi:protein of unknown function [Candidatus Methylocalor cossyra]|uniref:Integrase catalytic domain-containing protein n=1 Tax=Candidatus Methylocalor cossyra TaxID=3108543 RepID=A0ABM9NED2_9GAMM